MSQCDYMLFQSFPEGVIMVNGDIVTSINPAAMQLFPDLHSGMCLPPALAAAAQTDACGGRVTVKGTEYLITSSRAGEDRFILLRPAPHPELPLSEGTLRQLRALTGELLAELGPYTEPSKEDFLGCDLLKSLHRLFRLVDNANFLSYGPAGFHPVTLDLVGLCRRLMYEAQDLLAAAGINLSFECKLPSLLIAGDDALLRRMLLELISNGAKSAPGGRIVVTLSKTPSGALISVSDSGGPESVQQLTRAMLTPETPAIPKPHQGAGLGLGVAQRIASLHGGSLLSDCSGPTPRLMLSLPQGRITPYTGVRTPRLCTDGGLNPTLTALSDVLPAHIFELDGMD